MFTQPFHGAPGTHIANNDVVGIENIRSCCLDLTFDPKRASGYGNAAWLSRLRWRSLARDREMSLRNGEGLVCEADQS